MKKNHFFLCSRTCVMALMGASALFLASCAGDGFEDESFTAGNGVRNTKLTTPTVDDITITPSSDGSKQTISWPVVFGAGGYKAVLTNVTTNKVLVDSIIDNLSFATDREEDTNYKLTLKVLGNTSLGNTEGDEVNKEFSTFTATYARIPAGNLNDYFEQNPIPDELTDELNFDLEAGGKYTLSNVVDFGGHRVVLRSTSKTDFATITMQTGSTFSTAAGFTLKNVIIDATELNHAVVTLSETPMEATKDLIGTGGFYFITAPIVFQNCQVKALSTNILMSNVKYNVRNVMVNNCVIEIDGASTNTQAFVYMKAGYITDFTASNSTIYATAHSEKFFLQYGNRPKDISETEQRYVTISNCTLANIAWNKNFCDYHNGQTTYYYTLLNSIILDCGKANFVTGLNKGQASANPTWNVGNNTFWREGADASESQTGYTDNNKGNDTKLTTDPEINPATGDFVPAVAQQEAGQGDPRWFE